MYIIISLLSFALAAYFSDSVILAHDLAIS